MQTVLAPFTGTLPKIAQRWVLPGTGARVIRTSLLLVVAAATGYIVIGRNSAWLATGDYSHQVEMLDAAYWLHDHLGPTETAGAFNAGIMAFFSDRRITNLDGVINQAAFEAIQQKCLLCFMHEAGIRYYVDYEPIMREEFKPFWGNVYEPDWQPVGEIDRPEVDYRGSILRVYRIVWRS